MLDPVAFEIFGIQIRWYGIFIATAILLGIFIVTKLGKKHGYKEDDIIDLALVAIPSAIVGARIYYVIFNWSYYEGDFLKMINFRGGGLAIHGGVIAGVLAGYVFTKIRKLNFWELADFAAPAIILGQAIGRWGNYANDEAHGGPTNLPWGIMVDGQKVHPTFLYESLWNFAVFGFLMFYLRKKKKFQGQLFIAYVVLYSFARFFIEGMRTDSLMLGPIRVAQLISVVLILWGIYYYKKLKKTSLS
jgi:prolipoprotein diacylglyceryl transferase